MTASTKPRIPPSMLLLRLAESVWRITYPIYYRAITRPTALRLRIWLLEWEAGNYARFQARKEWEIRGLQCEKQDAFTTELGIKDKAKHLREMLNSNSE